MSEVLTISLCGDVMTGRGIDQILPHPCAPQIFEPYLQDARGYVALAERSAGEISKPVEFGYPWGEALDVWEKADPDLRIINLETSITTSNDYWKGKGINYRMHPGNIPCLTAARIDACALANNHVIDWGYSGLLDTLSVLHEAGVKTAGAGRNFGEAAAPAALVAPGKGRVLLISFGLDSSGIPSDWRATVLKPGVNLLPDLSGFSAARIEREVKEVRSQGDTVIASIHWGGNWGFEVTEEERRFARRLIDTAGVDIVHGHSSHHVKGIEVYRRRPIIYGCGDFINDYEGIRGYEIFRGDLALMYLPTVDPASGELTRLVMVPMKMHRFRLELASQSDKEWLAETLNREGRRFGTSVKIEDEGLVLEL